MKKTRQNAILSLIRDNVIETQEELIEKLAEKGYIVTQSTISRDIKELKLIKTASDDGRYKYATESRLSDESESKYLSILKETVRSVNYANNLLVVKTFSGMANAAAAAIDFLFSHEILGSIAGDDTIIAVADSNEDAEILCSKILHVQ